MLWKQIADHKHASKFMNPVTDEIANKYSTVIKGEVWTKYRASFAFKTGACESEMNFDI